MSHSAVAVFTGKSAEQILEDGGSSSWVLDRNHARRCEYLVCTQNTRAGEEWADGHEPHGAAFLVGRIAGVAAHGDGRYIIQIGEYARLTPAQPKVWQGWRNPVRYTTLEDLGIDLTSLTFEPAPKSAEAPPTAAPSPAAPMPAPAAAQEEDGVRPLTMAQAKQGLAAMYGVDVAAIEITIRG